ncbi:MAG: sigma-54 dependent transcriptional regulator [Desulfuromonadales bacterium]
MNNDLRSVLLVMDDRPVREELAIVLRKEIGCVVLEAATTAGVVEMLKRHEVCLLLTDLFLPGKSGIELLKTVSLVCSHVVTVVGIPAGDRESVKDAFDSGAFFHVNTPYDFHETLIVVAKGLHIYDLMVHREKRGSKIRKSESFYGMVGKSEAMQSLFNIVEKVAEEPDATVLVQGESGTGKELVARAIHSHSERRSRNFVPVNCAAIPEDLLESELFGYVKGAFTGAVQSKIGRIQYADGGTLFLDEIGDMKPSLQAKLLRMLQEREFEPVGGLRSVPVDVRVIAATHCSLEQRVADGRFREDLFYRLNVVPIEIPPLRVRRADISHLIETFVKVYNRGKREPLLGFTAEAVECLVRYSWPGNVREVENLVQHMVVLNGGKMVGLEEMPSKFTTGSDLSNQIRPAAEVPSVEIGKDGIDFNEVIGRFEEQLIRQALSQTGGNKKEAAKLLNLKRTTLTEKIKKRSINVGLG